MRTLTTKILSEFERVASLTTSEQHVPGEPEDFKLVGSGCDGISGQFGPEVRLVVRASPIQIVCGLSLGIHNSRLAGI